MQNIFINKYSENINDVSINIGKKEKLTSEIEFTNFKLNTYKKSMSFNLNQMRIFNGLA